MQQQQNKDPQELQQQQQQRRDPYFEGRDEPISPRHENDWERIVHSSD